jgi:hypothetical protein
MKNIITKFGIYAGLIVGVWVVLLAAIGDSLNMDYGMLYGYTAMLLSFSMIYVAVKTYRDTYNGGYVSFGRAFRIGLGITLIASTFYVVVWLIEYHFFVPDFYDVYAARAAEKMQAEGATEAEIQAAGSQIASFRELAENPLIHALITYTEILPVGLLVSLIAALILKKKPLPAL